MKKKNHNIEQKQGKKELKAAAVVENKKRFKRTLKDGTVIDIRKRLKNGTFFTTKKTLKNRTVLITEREFLLSDKDPSELTAGQLRRLKFYENKVHYAHQPNKFNPKMTTYLKMTPSYNKYAFYKNGKLHYLFKISFTEKLIFRAKKFAEQEAEKGKIFLFVGTTFQARSVVFEQAKRGGVYYVNSHWLGGLLTNWVTTKKQIEKLKILEEQKDQNLLEKLPIKEFNKKLKELKYLYKALNGIKNMPRIPDIVVITHQIRDITAVRECVKLGITTIGILDSDCNPDLIDHIVASNDDSLLPINFLLKKITSGIIKGYKKYSFGLLKN
jgi:small subunit ribosomal protein S2